MAEGFAPPPTARVAGVEQDLRWNFFWIAATGALFEGGAAFVDAAVVASFVSRLTPSTVAVGAAEAIVRFGWLLPQLLAANYAQGIPRRKPIYLLGGWGRATALGVLAAALWAWTDPDATGSLLGLFFVMWALYSLVSGLAGVPYNDIVGRTIPSNRRSRLLAGRVLVGGLLGVGVGVLIRTILGRPGVDSYEGYGLIFGGGAIVLALSTSCFAFVREPPAPTTGGRSRFATFLGEGVRVVRRDARLRRFVVAQWLAGITSMAVPFYVLQARSVGGVAEAEVGTFVAAQMLGALALNPLWGWWGDRRGKLDVLRAATVTSLLSPSLAILLVLLSPPPGGLMVGGYASVFLLLGAASSGRVIADLGYLMEISPDERRAEYSGYANVLVAPSRLLPLVGGALVQALSFHALFAVAAGAAVIRLGVVRRLARA